MIFENNKKAELEANSKGFKIGEKILWDAWYLSQPQPAEIEGFCYHEDKLCAILSIDSVCNLERIYKQ